MTDDGGGKITGSDALYYPFGGYRYTPSTNPDITDRGYTGHKENRDIGLTYMNARFYVSGIGRFASADTIVPNPTNPQSYNRYTYVRNQPLHYVDPSGNRECAFDDYCSPGNIDASIYYPTISYYLPEEIPDWVLDRETYEYTIVGLKWIDAQDDYWWGAFVSPEELIAYLLYREFSVYIGDPELWGLALEAATRRYNNFCSGGAWSAECVNGFWGYFADMRNVDYGPNAQQDMINSNMYQIEGGFYMEQARLVTGRPEMGGYDENRPFEWAHVNDSANPNTYNSLNTAAKGTGSSQVAGRQQGETVCDDDGQNCYTVLRVILTPNQYKTHCKGNPCFNGD